MFQTKLDRWLIETFVYNYHILTMRLPDKLPFGVKKVELPFVASSGFKYRLEISNSKTADKVLATLREEGLSFKTQVHERKHWYNWLINNKKKSFTFRIFWWVNISALMIFGSLSFYRFSKTDKFADFKEQLHRVLAPSNR